LHRFFYRHYFWKYVKYAEKVYYVTPESILFLKELYGFDNERKLEYLPLGGYIINENERFKIRKYVRRDLMISDNDIVLIHTGKLDVKKKSLELIKAFCEIKAENIKLLIVGMFSDDVYASVKDLIEFDDRILFLGWKEAEELQNYLCASDIYIQPGSRTVTVQNAVCSGCAIITNRSLCYTHLFANASMYAETKEEIIETLEMIIDKPEIIHHKKKILMEIAQEKLDYKIIANKYLKQ
jgi:glycosyltransferase involved in cell wall biosynthesis